MPSRHAAAKCHVTLRNRVRGMGAWGGGGRAGREGRDGPRRLRRGVTELDRGYAQVQNAMLTAIRCALWHSAGVAALRLSVARRACAATPAAAPA